MLLLLVPTIGAGGTPEAKDELKKFTGTWTVDGLTYDGEDHKLKFKIIFKGDEGTVLENDKVTNEYAKIKFKIDPASKPRIFDIVVSGGSQTDSKMAGIYEFKGNELRICAKVFGTGRPDDFDAPSGSNTVLLTLKRAP
jgi:uncharacterized protein (TIGR03067 family)